MVVNGVVLFLAHLRLSVHLNQKFTS